MVCVDQVPGQFVREAMWDSPKLEEYDPFPSIVELNKGNKCQGTAPENTINCMRVPEPPPQGPQVRCGGSHWLLPKSGDDSVTRMALLGLLLSVRSVPPPSPHPPGAG